MNKQEDEPKLTTNVPYREAYQRGVESQAQEILELKAKYYELIFAVATKTKGETRHQTALRYIMQREDHMGEPTKQAQGEQR